MIICINGENMSIEHDIFKRAEVDFKKLETYGFKKNDDFYTYSKKFLNNFLVNIKVDSNGMIFGKVYDLDLEEEYTNFRIDNLGGSFVNEVREAYKSLLIDICNCCFTKKYFITDQANRITLEIKKLYGDEPEFVFEKSPEYGVFRNPSNKKWYGLLYAIDIKKLNSNENSREVEAINVKLNEKKVAQLLNEDGYFTCYHMNKKKWITIILNDTLSDELVMSAIKESYELTMDKKEWLIPANPKFYDVEQAFKNENIILWKQSSKVNVNDIIYLYLGAPYSAIMYKCLAIEVDIPYNYEDCNLTIKKAMRIKLLKRYNKEQYSFSKLSELGIKSIRGPRGITPKLKEKLEEGLD